MPIVRRTRAEIDEAKLLAKLATRSRPSEDEIEAQAAEDGDAWADEELAEAEPIYPPPSPQRLRALRARLGLTQAQFARRFGFSLDTVQQYEQGRRRPSGQAATLLRVIEADPNAVVRALGLRRSGCIPGVDTIPGDAPKVGQKNTGQARLRGGNAFPCARPAFAR